MPPGTPKSMKIDQIMEGHVQKIWGRAFSEKTPCGRTLSREGLVNCNGIIKDHKSTSFDSPEPFLTHIPPFGMIPTANSSELRPAGNERGPVSKK